VGRTEEFVWPREVYTGLHRAHSLNKRKTLGIITSAWLAPAGLWKRMFYSISVAWVKRFIPLFHIRETEEVTENPNQGLFSLQVSFLYTVKLFHSVN